MATINGIDEVRENQICRSVITAQKQGCEEAPTQNRSLLEVNKELSRRLLELRRNLSDVYRENALIKMKRTVTLGSMKLEMESLLEDRQFLIEKYYDLKLKIDQSTNDLRAKDEELVALQATQRERTNSM